MTSTVTHEDMGTQVEEVLRQRFTAHSENAQAYGSEFASLWRSAATHALGGKLVRPRLLLDIHRALAPVPTIEQASAAIDVATHIELLHYAFLLHDDVIDGDLTRRRGPNLIGALAAESPGSTEEASLHWARSSAILMGDLLLSAAVMGFARADLSQPTRLRLLDLVEQTILETVAGEHTDVALSHGIVAPDLHTVLNMSVYKTATYSFSLPLRAGAMLAGASSSAEDALHLVGRHLGLAYQLQDDLLCVFGDHRVHGKDAFSDLREGKETAIIAYARSTPAWSRIERAFGSDDLTMQQATEIRDRLRECGAEAFVTGLIADQREAVQTLLSEAEASGEISADAAATIAAVATRLDGRRS
ncbi:polyprenyl synthetase family protein [uncultured Microbacterium sp.]|uniref:polyprenyl synthetase family protein n=1 Tax=uncultured Microbacterium sp. TaxID=191216 RepID=UPI0028D25337|nr:polyprenyl synthetase family protein [uncultured Microbacterium sp.]